MEKILYDEELGAITLRTSVRAKHYSLRVQKEALVAVMPENGNEQFMLAFIDKNRGKLIRILEKSLRHRLVLDDSNEMQTHTFKLHIFHTDRNNVYVSLKEGILHIACPLRMDFKNEKTQQLLKDLFVGALRHEAERVLPLRLHTLAAQHGFSYANVKIGKARSRWGVCNAQRIITLSLSLMLLPGHLIDYVLLHELCHTVEMNHGKRFWNLMNKVTGNQALALRKELQDYRTL
jgi:predicted metal-dependent hydrolase